jgi:hypothetical protein
MFTASYGSLRKENGKLVVYTPLLGETIVEVWQILEYLRDERSVVGDVLRGWSYILIRQRMET